MILANISEKLHEIEKILVSGGFWLKLSQINASLRGWRPHVRKFGSANGTLS